MNSAEVSLAVSGVKCSTAQASMPLSASSASFSSVVVISCGQ